MSTLPQELKNAKIIWTKDEKATYCRRSDFDTTRDKNFHVVTFKKTFDFGKDIKNIKFNIYADTRYFMWINGIFRGRGPVCAGGDYGMEISMDKQYYSTYSVDIDAPKAEFTVRVQLDTVVQADTTCGRGCLVIGGEALLSDGSTEEILTDESWLCTVDKSYPEPDVYDYRVGDKVFESAMVVTDDERILQKSEIPLLCEDRIPAPGFTPCEIREGRSQGFHIGFDKIYSAFIYIDAEGDTDYTIEAYTYENLVKGSPVINRPLTEKISAHGKLCHIGHTMRSVGTMIVTVVNNGDKPLKINDMGIYYSHYPTEGDNGSFKCSDKDLNDIYSLCRHTLEICRQSIHLDSPLHQENLGCCGDYYIEALMGYYAFADTRLSRFDIVRIGDCLLKNNGTAFHTTYSFIWVQMLYDYYMYTGDISIISRCEEAVKTLLAAAYSWTDENGLIDTPPNFMFVDWTVSDNGFSRHHPPKAMGQSVMNAFYYNALCRGSYLMEVIGNKEQSTVYFEESKRVKFSFNKYFYNAERGLYIDGLTTPTPAERISNFMPENVQKVSYTMYPNILSCLYGICPEDKAAELLERTLYKENLEPIQMYFMHFALDALYKTGLFAKYGLNEIRRWKAVCDECSKGLKEGWIQLHFHFDYSHAWGGTPLYQLPARISGLEILEPGMKKIRLNPELCDLDWAEMVIPSPYGAIEIKIGDEVEVLLPEEIEITD